MSRRPGKLPRLTTLKGGRRYALAIARHGELAEAFSRLTNVFQLTREKHRGGPFPAGRGGKQDGPVLWHESLDADMATKH